ncbi:MAG: sigma-70 family RNA polymerase sigma factor [Candidatus Kapabacteria bacterium]|nr:sigma-70 family RNA polymerase sigma factor [Candidatus Kapabacteria bacterium]
MQLLEPLYDRLERFALTMTRDREAARELVCETVAAAYERFAHIHDEQAFLSYLFTIASRCFHRNRLRKQRYQPMESDVIDELYAGGTTPEQSMAVSELYDALDKLPAIDREVIVMAEIIGLTHKEISVALDISIANIKVKVFRSKRKLSVLLDANGGEEPTTDNHQKPLAALLI